MLIVTQIIQLVELIFQRLLGLIQKLSMTQFHLLFHPPTIINQVLLPLPHAQQMFIFRPVNHLSSSVRLSITTPSTQAAQLVQFRGQVAAPVFTSSLSSCYCNALTTRGEQTFVNMHSHRSPPSDGGNGGQLLLLTALSPWNHRTPSEAMMPI